MNARARAQALLRHYLSLGNAQWSHDNAVEVDQIVDLIVDAAAAEVVARLRSDGFIPPLPSETEDRR